MSMGMGLVRLAAALLLSFASGCAAITQGTTQAINIDTSPKSGARCEARNGSNVWHLPATPGQVTISKAYSDLTVSCSHADGSKGEETVASSTIASTFGNAIIGGGVGIIVDVASGAAYEYPSRITVFMSQPDALNVVAPAWTAPAAGTRLTTKSGALSVQEIRDDTVVFADGNGAAQHALYGMLRLQGAGRDISLNSGSLFPMKIGAKAVLSERPAAGGIVLEHTVSVKSVEDVTVGTAKHQAFRLLDTVKVVGTSANLQDERRHIWYVPTLGMAVRVQAEALNGAPVAARSFEVTEVGVGG